MMSGRLFAAAHVGTILLCSPHVLYESLILISGCRFVKSSLNCSWVGWKAASHVKAMLSSTLLPAAAAVGFAAGAVVGAATCPPVAGAVVAAGFGAAAVGAVAGALPPQAASIPILPSAVSAPRTMARRETTRRLMSAMVAPPSHVVGVTRGAIAAGSKTVRVG